VINTGVDLKEVQPRSPTGHLPAELGLTLPFLNSPPIHQSYLSHPSHRLSSPKLIATIGQIGPRKGQDLLIRAMPAIVDRIPDAHFVFIGTRTSQKQESIDFEQSIVRDATVLGLADHVHLLGYRNDVSTLLNEIDLLVHPARQEPFGRVLLEASAAGVPIVATNVGGTAEIIVDRQTGILVSPEDHNALAEAVTSVLLNPTPAERLGKSARIRASQQFSNSIAAEKLAHVWTELIAATL
jgi:glycosyltransferase involved in cell wall biosynthesis